MGVTDLHAARAALAWAAAGGHRIVLYGIDGRRAGMGYWQACAELLARPLVVDCEAHVGTALAALRAGLRLLHTGDLGPATPTFRGLAAAHGAVLVAAPAAVRVCGLRPVAAQLARWRLDQVTGSADADKTPF